MRMPRHLVTRLKRSLARFRRDQFGDLAAATPSG